MAATGGTPLGREGAPSPAALVAACLAKTAAYTARELEFIRSIEARRSLSQAQIAWLEALAERVVINFPAVNAAALSALPALLARWLPDGRPHGHEYVARNPTRHDNNPGSFRINLNTGKWADFADAAAKGGDPISLAAYLHYGGDQVAAARALSEMLRV